MANDYLIAGIPRRTTSSASPPSAASAKVEGSGTVTLTVNAPVLFDH